MRSVTIFIISILVIFIIIALLGLLLPSEVTITKSVLVKASPEKVSLQINDFSNWKNWYPVMQKKKVNVVVNNSSTISLTDDAGKQISLHLIKNTHNELNVEVSSPSSVTVMYQFIVLPHTDGNTQLTLNVNTFFKWYPWEKMKGVLLDKISGPQYLSMLYSLKAAAEK